MIVYIESSAMLAWWLDEPAGADIRRCLSQAQFLVTSDLTRIECDRAFLRGMALGQWSASAAQDRQRRAADFWESTEVLRFDVGVVERARQPFPGGILRTLDALHLAFFAATASGLGETAMLSLDQRVRSAAQAMGSVVLPQLLS